MARSSPTVTPLPQKFMGKWYAPHLTSPTISPEVLSQKSAASSIGHGEPRPAQLFEKAPPRSPYPSPITRGWTLVATRYAREELRGCERERDATPRT